MSKFRKTANSPHMRVVQADRMSNMAGFHGGTKKQKNRRDRKRVKEELRVRINSSDYYKVLGKSPHVAVLGRL